MVAIFYNIGDGIMSDGQTITSSSNSWKMMPTEDGGYRYPETEEERNGILKKRKILFPHLNYENREVKK